MRFIKLIGFISLFVFLTITTQVGGLILLGYVPLYILIKKRVDKIIVRYSLYFFSFITIYLLVVFLIIPPIAKKFGRVPLPIRHETLQPLNLITCILNRHYVKKELRTNIENVSIKVAKKHPNTVISYLDANFPFYNGFPLLPHLSHNDGKKLDIAFLYKDRFGIEINNDAPSFIGYGVFEKPKNGEYNTPRNCESKGHWQYSLLGKIVPQWNNNKMIFDPIRTESMINLLLQEKSTQKIFIEPHLKTRMGFQNNKIRFHGCRAVRHDDHVHLQIK